MEVTGRLEESGGRFFVNTAGRQRPVARCAFDSARDLVGQEVQGEFTREGVTDLVALAAVVDEIDEAVTRPRAGDGEFFNPYTFIPAPARRTDATAFGDGTPIGHDRYRPDRWTGRIRVQLTTGSPLIISDAGAATWDEHDHGIFPTRTRNDGTPIIPTSSVKGMIRSAFEAVTVSRFGLFDAKHESKLSHRDGWTKRQFQASPADLAKMANLTPAAELTRLSAADRVFGWVNAAKGDDRAVRGHVRIGSVEADQATVSEFDGQGVPLAILSGPKPTQARFYAAKNLDGDPLDDRSPKQAGYRPDGGLRGRKVYPPHRVADNHWENPADVQMPREFQRTGGFRDDQNRSVTSWVDPGSTFHFDMWVDNLTDAEFGALLHVVSMPDDTFLRLGGGRPLGFGSVHLSVDWDESELTGPEQITINDRYRSLSPPPTGVTEEIGNQVDRPFKEALVELVGADSARDVLNAYTASIQGGDGPVHYPRAAAEADPQGKNYVWFTRNEKQENGRVKCGRGLSLPAPYGPLPFHPR